MFLGPHRDAGQTPGHGGGPGKEGRRPRGLHRRAPDPGDGHRPCSPRKEHNFHEKSQARLKLMS